MTNFKIFQHKNSRNNNNNEINNCVVDDEIQDVESKMVKLSLITYFDDFCRYQNYLSSYEKSLYEDFGKLLKICEQFKTKWYNTAKELKQARKIIEDLNDQNKKLENELKCYKKKYQKKSDDYDKINKELLDIRLKVEQFTNVLNRNRNLELNKITTKSDYEENEEFMKKLNHLRSADNHDDIELNKMSSDEKIENYLSDLKTIIESEEEHIVQNDERITGKPLINDNANKLSTPNNSSDLTIDASEEDDLKSNGNLVDINNNDDKFIDMNVKQLKHLVTNGDEVHQFDHLSYHSLRPFNQLQKSSARMSHSNHDHVWKLNRSSSHRMIICTVCNNRIGFYNKYASCDICTANAHEQCIPHGKSLMSNDDRQTHLRTIMDFVNQSESPFVPTLLIKCCAEIEKRGIKMIDIYDCNIQKNSVIQNLMIDLLHPKYGYNIERKISQMDVDSLCSIVIYFLGYLADLGDPLIPEFLYGTLENAFEKNMDVIDPIVNQLPTSNRDTLAFLLIHLRKIAKNQNHNNMSIEKLAKIFAPKIFKPTIPLYLQENVMISLLSTSSDFWLNILTQKISTDSSPQSAALDNSFEENTSMKNIIQSPCSFKSTVTSDSIYNTPIGGGYNINNEISTPKSSGKNLNNSIRDKIRTFERLDFSRILVENLKF